MSFLLSLSLHVAAMSVIDRFLEKVDVDSLILPYGRDVEGRVCLGMDASTLLPAAFTSEEDWKLMLQFFCLIFDAQNNNLEEARRGVVWVMDGKQAVSRSSVTPLKLTLGIVLASCDTSNP